MPTLTVGLPVYNGERFLAQALDDLLAQTLTDLEVVISDNASTDATPSIARAYAERDARVRYLRQDHNLGAAGNHDAVLAAARGRYFAWGSDDDRYAPTLYERCIAALEADPGLILAHAHAAFIGEDGSVVAPAPYLLDTASPDPARRLRSLLHGSGGNDFYGVARTEVFREIGPLGSFHNADRVHVTAFALRGRFHQVPEVLYFRRDHPGRGERLPGLRARCVGLDPRRADRLRHPIARLLIEYVAGYVRLILVAPLSPRDRARCLGALGGWLLSRVLPGRGRRIMATTDPAVSARRAGGRPRVAALGYYGIGNLGNEALLAAFADRLRRDVPEAELSVLAVDPGAVRAEHGLPATRLMSYRRDLAGGGPVVTALKVLGRLADLPRLFRAVGGVDAVVVPGSGVMETGLGLRPWGLPYWLFVVALCCRLRGRRLALISIGAEPGRDRTTRRLHRWTAALATSVSVRDQGSRRALAADGVRRPVGVAPDLVFGTDLDTDLGTGVGAGVPGHVALGVMAYYGGPQTPERGPAVREAYTAALAKLTDELLARGHTVTLVIGDAADREVAEDVAARVGTIRAAGTVRVSPAQTLAEVARELARAEVVLASRFHTLVAALALGRPCVALGYAPKSAELLAAFGLDPATQPMDRIDAAELATQLERARGVLPDPRALPRLRAALDLQYDHLWKELRP
jgi:polysaccharide pyruvyl transferase WcaK-like protein/glycosyltransferase involved in cell wall biosynthesis